MGPFTVTKEMVAVLGDEQLRALLGKLLDAEAKQWDISLAGIAVGGNQTAGDSGVDASIRWTGSPVPAGWLPRRTIYFQSKAEAMAAAALTKEMNLNGALRPIFAELVNARGAYIVFSTDDPSKLGYDRRLAAMQAAIANLPSSNKVYLDFYGADKIARWINQHTGVALWLHEQRGRPLGGWRPYGGWSTNDATDHPYMFDAAERVAINGAKANIQIAIATMRDVLSSPGGVVRLIGISGMGKTRLAEALFDPTLLQNALPQSSAIYGDAGLELAIGASLLAEQISHDSTRAVIVVDNCRPTTHHQLAEIVSRIPSRASLLTIDYDVGGEQPVGTLVSLNDNSEDVLRAVLEQRFPQLNSTERDHVARFSGGNARIALRIAAGGGQGVDLSKLNDRELLERLFQTNRQHVDPAARQCAEAASLVYAFYIADADGHQSEYIHLAAMAGVSSAEFHRWVAIFLEWGIVQKRGPQRAVMPPPLANMLAAPFIRRSDPEVLVTAFVEGPERLLASFARRLGQLHGEPAAVVIAERLYGPGGVFGAPEQLNKTLRGGFIFGAPSAPHAALDAITRALASPLCASLAAPSAARRREFTLLLVHLAHEAHRFRHAMDALLAFVVADGPSPKDDTAKHYFLERFRPALSFTHAPLKTRLAYLDGLLGNLDNYVRSLGVEALDQMLSRQFSSSIDLDFGSRSLATEWRPRGDTAYRDWLEAAYDRAVSVAISGRAEAEQARYLIAKHFREHTHPEWLALAVAAMHQVRGATYWDAGWRAANDALHFEREKLKPADLALVEALERALRPKTLDECFQAFALGEPWRHWHPGGREKRLQRNVARLAQATGRCLGNSGLDVTPYLERAASATGHNNVGWFTAGLARSMSDLDALWQKAYRLLASAPLAERHPRLLAGILESAARRDAGWVEARLDEAVTDPVLADHLVVLNTTIPLGDASISRFSRALKSGLTAPNQFDVLTSGGVTKSLNGKSLAAFLSELYEHDNGVATAIEVLHMRYFGDSTDGVLIDPALVETGRVFLTNARTYAADGRRTEYDIREICEVVLRAPEAHVTAAEICRALNESARSNPYAYQNFDQLCALLMKSFPRVVLNEIISSGMDQNVISRFFGGWARDDDDRGRELAQLNEVAVLGWVREDPDIRGQLLAPYVPYYTFEETSGELRWSTLALELIAAAADPTPILDSFEDRFSVGSGIGPWSLRLVRRRPLLAALSEQCEPQIRQWAEAARERLERKIVYWDERDRDQDSRFE